MLQSLKDGKISMLWFDDTKGKPLKMKCEEAVRWFEEKYDEPVREITISFRDDPGGKDAFIVHSLMSGEQIQWRVSTFVQKDHMKVASFLTKDSS